MSIQSAINQVLATSAGATTIANAFVSEKLKNANENYQTAVQERDEAVKNYGEQKENYAKDKNLTEEDKEEISDEYAASYDSYENYNKYMFDKNKHFGLIGKNKSANLLNKETEGIYKLDYRSDLADFKNDVDFRSNFNNRQLAEQQARDSLENAKQEKMRGYENRWKQIGGIL